MYRCFRLEKNIHPSMYRCNNNTYHIFRLKKRIHYSVRHTLLFSFEYSMFANNIVTISPFNDSGVIDAFCPL